MKRRRPKRKIINKKRKLKKLHTQEEKVRKILKRKHLRKTHQRNKSILAEPLE